MLTSSLSRYGAQDNPESVADSGRSSRSRHRGSTSTASTSGGPEASAAASPSPMAMSLQYPSPRLANGPPMPPSAGNVPYTESFSLHPASAIGWPQTAPSTSYLPQVFLMIIPSAQVSPYQAPMYDPAPPPLFANPGLSLPPYDDSVRTFRTRRRLLHSNRRQAGGRGPYTHPGPVIPGAGISSRFKCKYCPKDFKHESTKCRHEKEHWNDPYPCPECGCGQTFKRRDSMMRHLQLMHGQTRSPRGHGHSQS